MILRLEIILSSVVFNERKNIIFYKKNLKLTDKNTFNNGFCNKICHSITSYEFFINYWIFINHGLFFRGKYSLQLYYLQLKEQSFQWLKSLEE